MHPKLLSTFLFAGTATAALPLHATAGVFDRGSGAAVIAQAAPAPGGPADDGAPDPRRRRPRPAGSEDEDAQPGDRRRGPSAAQQPEAGPRRPPPGSPAGGPPGAAPGEAPRSLGSTGRQEPDAPPPRREQRAPAPEPAMPSPRGGPAAASPRSPGAPEAPPRGPASPEAPQRSLGAQPPAQRAPLDRMQPSVQRPPSAPDLPLARPPAGAPAREIEPAPTGEPSRGAGPRERRDQPREVPEGVRTGEPPRGVGSRDRRDQPPRAVQEGSPSVAPTDPASPPRIPTPQTGPAAPSTASPAPLPQQPAPRTAPSAQPEPQLQPQSPAPRLQQPAPQAPAQAPVQAPAPGQAPAQAPIQAPAQIPGQIPGLPPFPGAAGRAQPGAERFAPGIATGGRDVRIDELRSLRRERVEEGGRRIIIEEPGNRIIVREGDREFIRHDETERFRRAYRDADVRMERRGAQQVTVIRRPDGVEILTIRDPEGNLIRRVRRDPRGVETILIENEFAGRPRRRMVFEEVVGLPPLRVTIPREKYIVEVERASPEDLYEAFTSPPLERIERRYSLDEVRYSRDLRERVRRVDVDTVTFEFGSWQLSEDQIGALTGVANAIRRTLDANPNEIYLIEGHTDSVGADVDNLTLSDRRAETAATILTERFGIPAENLTTQGYGEQYLKIATQEPERENRRVTVRRITPLLQQQAAR